MSQAGALDALKAVYPEGDRLSGPAAQPYCHDQSRQAAECSLVVFPRTHQQLVDTVKLASENGFALVPSGGRTGLSGGASARGHDVVVSFDKMNALLAFNREAGEITVQAGMTIQRLQQLAAEAGWFYPVDYASRGTAQVGGALATNAGGVRVLRYGMTRDQVLGLTAVTGCGETLAIDRCLVKDNAGFDLKNLLIGSEGTLAVISSATFRLARPMAEQQTVLLGFADMPSLMACYSHLAKAVDLNAAEFFCRQSQALVAKTHDMAPPMADKAWYLLLEYNRDGISDEFLMQSARGADVVVAQSIRQAQTLWQWRELISGSIQPLKPCKQDLACHFTVMNDWLVALQKQVRALEPTLRLLLFGHLGDGNVHVNIIKPEAMSKAEFAGLCPQLDTIVAALSRQFHATVSAEHGIGTLKKTLLPAARSDEELAVYRRIKQVFDPHNILNPGKLL